MRPMLLLLTMFTLNADPLKPGDHTRSLDVDKRTRSYIVHVPPGYDGKKPIPVVLAFHGGGSNAEQMVRFCGLNEKADKEGFLVVYPNGTGRLEKLLTFNGGNCCGYAMNQKVDDVAFTRALLDDLAKVAKVDPKRVYATGMSNGAIMAYRLASELSDRIAAIAPVAGPMGTETCNPKRPVPVIHFHGTDDQNAPFKGGKGKNSISGTNFYSVDHSIRAWVKANGCKDGAGDDEVAQEGGRRHVGRDQDLRRRQGRVGGRPGRHRGRRAHLAGPGTSAEVPGEIDEERVGQRLDVGVLQEAR